MNFALAHPFQATISATFSANLWLRSKLFVREQSTTRAAQPVSTDLQLKRADIRQVSSPLGLTLKCVTGEVWITQDGDVRDTVLQAGEAVTLDRSQRTLVMALGDAHVQCIHLQRSV
jgi:hypothetical protein